MMNLHRSIKQISYNYGRFIKTKLFGLIGDNESDKETQEKIQFLERIAYCLMITRRGHDQDAVNYVQPYYNLVNYIIRSVASIMIIRFSVILGFSDDENIQIYLANPFNHLADSSNAFVLPYLVTICAIPCALLREYVLYMETQGAYKLLCTLRDIRLKGFDKNLLKLNDRQVKFYRSLFHFIITLSIRFMVVNAIIILPLLILARIVDSEFRNGSIIFFSCTAFWIIFEYIYFFFIIGGLIDLGTHIIIMVPLYQCQLETIIQKFKFHQKEKMINENILETLNTNCIRFMNEFDEITQNLRYLFFCVFVIIGFLADSIFFLGSFVPLHSVLIANAFAAGGLCVLGLIGGVAYAAGAYLDKLYMIHGQFISLSARSRVTIKHKLKTLEILDRIMGPYTGGKIGDSFDATRLLALNFVLENASTIMLIICTVQSLMY